MLYIFYDLVNFLFKFISFRMSYRLIKPLLAYIEFIPLND